MRAFKTKVQVRNQDVGVNIIPLEKDKKFRIEKISNKSDSLILTRSEHNQWLIEDLGNWNFSDEEFQSLGKVLEQHLNKIYTMKTILVLSDFSDTSFIAARYAASLAHQLGTSRLILYHSYEFIPVAADIPVPELQNFFEESTDSLSKLKNDLQPFTDENITIETLTDERPLIEAVRSITDKEHAGLVIMGISGKSQLQKMIVGSNTVSIAKECSVPLLIVPREAKFDKIHRILFACDLKEVLTTTPSQVLKTLIHSLGARLVILNVDHNNELSASEALSEQTALHELWDSENAEYHYIDREDTAEGIMEFADKNDIQLVVTVPKKYGFFENLFHRSLTKKLAFHTRIPLMLLEEGI